MKRSRLVENRMAVIAGDKWDTSFHSEQRDEEQAEIVVRPFGITPITAASGTDPGLLFQAGRPGLNADDE